MLAYWLLFALPAAALLTPVRASLELRQYLFLFATLLFIVILGLRFQIGADWGNHLKYYESYSSAPFFEIVKNPDFGFLLVNRISGLVGGEVYLVNFLCSLFFMAGLMTFCLRQLNPWLALLVSIPYLVIVVSLGYVRQGVAIGFEFFAIVALLNGHLRKFFIYIFCAISFHISAIVLIPLALLTSQSKNIKFLYFFGSLAFAFLLSIYRDQFWVLWVYYSSGVLSSEGGFIRVLMNVPPAILLLTFRNRFFSRVGGRKFWVVFSILSLLLIPLFPIGSTLIDRIALYFIPLQIFVFSNLQCLSSNSLVRSFLGVSVISSYALVQFVWLNYAFQSSSWVPYQFAPFTFL